MITKRTKICLFIVAGIILFIIYGVCPSFEEKIQIPNFVKGFLTGLFAGLMIVLLLSIVIEQLREIKKEI
jgi:hypothetical protein